MTEPVSLAKLKAHLRIFHSMQDDLLNDLLTDARELVEADTWMCLVPTTKTIVRRCFPQSNSPGAPSYPYGGYPGNSYQAGTFPAIASTGIRGPAEGPLFLPGPPARTVVSVQYLDADGNQQTISDYRANLTAIPGWIEPARGSIWPTTCDDPNAVVVTYTAGYDSPDATGEDVINGPCPGPLRRAILLLAGEMYESGVPADIRGRSTLDRLLEKYRIRHSGILESL